MRGGRSCASWTARSSRAERVATTRAVRDAPWAATGLDEEDEELVHAARSLRSAIHGFVSLETAAGYGLPGDVERSYRWMVQTVALGLEEQSALR